jgi:glycosyltransferase involved in cell wall biosynthesis
MLKSEELTYQPNKTFILVVTGSLPPDVCGCGDYAQTLVNEMQRKGVMTEVFYRRDWSLRQLPAYFRAIRKSQARVVNIQYPTQGYGWSILPQLLCCFLRRFKRVVTLHEFSQKTTKAKLAIYLFFISADWVIFTTEFERKVACRVAPWLKGRSSVVLIGSMIPLREAQQPDTDIVYFGLIHPAKGIEDFIVTLSRLGVRQKLRIRAIGQIAPGYEDYAAEILPQLEALGIEVVLNRSSEDVSQVLSRTRVAFLPFPDGMSRRRSSALAAMGNGALLLTTVARTETELFRRICAMPANGSDLCELLTDVLENYDSYDSIRRAGQEFAQSISWDSVAVAYVEVVDRLLRSGG